MSTPMNDRSSVSVLPEDDALRMQLHNEVHARPTPLIRMPALIAFVAVLNEGISREQELEHLRLLPGQEDLELDGLSENFLRLTLDVCSVKWERHTEFTRYTVVQAMPDEVLLGVKEPQLTSQIAINAKWLRSIPGRVICAIELAMLHGDLDQQGPTLELARRWFGGRPVVASLMGSNGHSFAMTDFHVCADGFERMVVVAPTGTPDTRPGRIAQRLFEIETYRMMALKGLVVVKDIGSMLTQSEQALAEITTHLEGKVESDPQLLEALVALAAGVERAIALHNFRFSATRAYKSLVDQRINELREKIIPGHQTIGEFMQRRLSPAIATVAATEQRLTSLSQRISRTSALLRTKVDIATEEQNQLLLEKLTRGQEMQLRLQSTVEGLSIAAISYYVVSLLLYGGKALKSAGIPINPEVAAGALIPLVLWAVWRTTQSIHRKFHSKHTQ